MPRPRCDHAATIWPAASKPSPMPSCSIHPECGCATSALYLVGEGVVPAARTHILSTGGMLTKATAARRCQGSGRDRDRHAASVAQANPVADFEPVNPKAATAAT